MLWVSECLCTTVFPLSPVFFPSLTPSSVLHCPCHLFERLTDDRLIIIIAS